MSRAAPTGHASCVASDDDLPLPDLPAEEPDDAQEPPPGESMWDDFEAAWDEEETEPEPGDFWYQAPDEEWGEEF